MRKNKGKEESIVVPQKFDFMIIFNSPINGRQYKKQHRKKEKKAVTTVTKHIIIDAALEVCLEALHTLMYNTVFCCPPYYCLVRRPSL